MSTDASLPMPAPQSEDIIYRHSMALVNAKAHISNNVFIPLELAKERYENPEFVRTALRFYDAVVKHVAQKNPHFRLLRGLTERDIKTFYIVASDHREMLEVPAYCTARRRNDIFRFGGLLRLYIISITQGAVLHGRVEMWVSGYSFLEAVRDFMEAVDAAFTEPILIDD